MPAWPDSLPAPSIQGYGLEPEDMVLRTQMQMGPARQRRQYTRAPTRIPVRWVFKPLHMQIFESWYHHEIEDGQAWFDVALQTGAGITTLNARFVGVWKSRLVSKVSWEVTGMLEVKTRPLLTAGQLEPYL